MPIHLSPSERGLDRIVQAIRQLIQGRDDAGGSVTLTANAGTTTVAAPNCAAGSQVYLSPKTAHAAAALATTYVSAVANASFTITHANNAQTDKDFWWRASG